MRLAVKSGLLAIVIPSLGCTEPGNQFGKGQEILDQEGGGYLWNKHHRE